MFERFTDRARQAVVFAQDEARRLNHNYIGTEHLLLGLLRDGETVAGWTLAAVGVSLAAARGQVEELIGRGEAPAAGHIPFTPRAKKVLELSLREALHLGHNYIGSEHILLGVLREGEGVAAQVLVRLGGDLARVRQEVLHQLSGDFGDEPSTRSAGPGTTTGVAVLTGLERLDDAVLDVLIAARVAARAAGSPVLRPAHLLVGLAHSESPARQALIDAGTQLDRLAGVVEAATRGGERATLPPLTADARRVLDIAAASTHPGPVDPLAVLAALLAESTEARLAIAAAGGAPEVRGLT